MASDVAAQRRFLARASAVYERVRDGAERAFRAGDVERALARAASAARIACFAHTGRFADARLEQLLLEIGSRVPEELGIRPHSHSDRRGAQRVLHVATRLLATGGHTRLLLNWIHNDPETIHSVVITDEPSGLPSSVSTALAESGVEVTLLDPRTTRCERAARLRALARQRADLVLVHAHQFDVIVPVAFATPHVPPVVFVNHSDHTFWIGSAVADTIVCLRRFASDLTSARRLARAVHQIPIPLRSPSTTVSRGAARAALGIGADEVLLLSMGASYKFIPTASHDFVEAAEAILARNPSARLIMVGVGVGDAAMLRPGGVLPDRLELVGVQADPSVYQAAADIYLEAFPYGSLTALLESVTYGACPVLMFAPIPQLDSSDDPGLAGVVERTGSLGEYVELVTSLVADRERCAAAGRKAAAAIISHHIGAEWRAAVQRVYADMARVAHVPCAPRATPPRADEADLHRAAWDEGLFGRAPLAELGAPLAPTLGEIVRLAAASIAAGDTSARFRHARAWLAALKNRAMGTFPE